MTSRPYLHTKRAGKTIDRHVLVWTDANGPVPPGHVVHHRNHDKHDNRLDNLQLMTFAEHAQHHNDKHARIKHCVVCDGSYEPPPTKRKRSQTCSSECWKRLLSAQRTAFNGNRKLTADDRDAIRRRVDAGERRCDLASEFGVSRQTVSRVTK